MKSGEKDVDVIAAFETSKIELEILAVKKTYSKEVAFSRREDTEFKTYFPCVRISWTFVGIPELAYQQEFQRGAVHRGRATIHFQGLVVTQKQLDEYINRLAEEDLELLSAVDESILALRDDLDKYLKRAGELPQEEKKEEKRESLLAPLGYLGKGLSELGRLTGKMMSQNKNSSADEEKSAAAGRAKTDAYIAYKLYKKSKKMFAE